MSSKTETCTAFGQNNNAKVAMFRDQNTDFKLLDIAICLVELTIWALICRVEKGSLRALEVEVDHE